MSADSRGSWSNAETATLLGTTVRTLFKYEKMGVIPLPTYPSGKRRYWTYQVLLLINLLRAMRREGWPHRTPHFVGSAYWTDYLTRLRSEWDEHADRYAGSGDDHEKRENGTGEHAGV